MFYHALNFIDERYVAQYRDLKTGVVNRLAPGTKVRFFWNPLGELAEQIWLTDEAGENCLGMCAKLYEASWADPHSIKVAMGQQQAQIAELMSETRAVGEMQGVRRLAAEKMNVALVEAAKETAAAPVAFGGGSVDVLALTRQEDDMSTVQPSTSDLQPEKDTDFFARMNGYSMNV